MAKKKKDPVDTELQAKLALAVLTEIRKCEKCYLWMQEHMPPKFFEEVTEDNVLLIAHSLMGLDLQGFFAILFPHESAFVLCLESKDADLKILEQFKLRGIRNYRTFVSNNPPPFPGITQLLRIAVIDFITSPDLEQAEAILSPAKRKELKELVKARNPEITDQTFSILLEGLSPRFLRAMPNERLIVALDLFFRALTRDPCQYEVLPNAEWQKTKDTPSLRVVLAWRNVPKQQFLYNLTKLIQRHGLVMPRVNATYIDPYGKDSVLIMSLALHGAKGGAAWDEADIPDFLKEMVSLKYFGGQTTIEKTFVDSRLVRGNLGNLIKTMAHFIHQTLTHADVNVYSLSNVEEGLCRHPELTAMVTEAFEWKFHPQKHNLKEYEKTKEELLKLIDRLDTGNDVNDARRKNILYQAANFIEHTLKTNFYRNNKTAFSFRLDPKYLNHLPYDRKEKFPELPFSVFFMKGMFFLAFHIRFKDLARGGLRTVFPQKMEQMFWERNNVFSECYNLAYTQQKKNKDIPEGGAKAVIFLEPYDQLQLEAVIYKEEMTHSRVPAEEIEKKLAQYHKEQKLEYLYQSQRSFTESFLTILNCEDDGTLRAKHVVDYWKKPEYIYLGPDENMHNEMLEWISQYSKKYNYRPLGSFISSRPGAGINHKEYGVTSYGVNVYMEEVLKYLGIDPFNQPFTVKISGGPDGDVAGNQIVNLYRFFPKTAKLLALTDGSGTIYDPIGLDLKTLSEMFKRGEPIRYYPPDLLAEEGFLLDLATKQEKSAYIQQTLCWRKKGKKLVKEWLSGHEMNHLYRSNVHQTKTHVFIPAGGRPRTLSEQNYKDYLDESGKPTSLAIVEGANLYLTPGARRALEQLGVLIIKDSSANKGGVITSSYEILSNFVLTEEQFIREKKNLMPEILAIIRKRAQDEARLLLLTHAETGGFLTDISDQISAKINLYKYQILDYLVSSPLTKSLKDSLVEALMVYCPPLLRGQYAEQIVSKVPDIHKKAIIATYIASKTIYTRGVDWSPSIIETLPLLAKDPQLYKD